MQLIDQKRMNMFLGSDCTNLIKFARDAWPISECKGKIGKTIVVSVSYMGYPWKQCAKSKINANETNERAACGMHTGWLQGHKFRVQKNKRGKNK